MAKTDRDWERWGKNDPYYGVLSGEQFRIKNIKANQEAFFRSGDEFVASMLGKMGNAFGRTNRRNALDFGCGVGRLTQALATQFDHVVGLDISTSMLEKAATRPNITYALADDELSKVSGRFDLVNCYITLQHIAPARGLRIIENLLDRVEVQGCALIHVSVRRERMIGWRVYSALRANVPGANGILNIIRRRPWSDPQMRMSHYGLADVIAAFDKASFGDLVLFREDHGGVMTVGFIGQRLAAPQN